MKDLTDIKTEDLLWEIYSRVINTGLNPIESELLSDIASLHPITDNVMDEFKMEAILPNLWKKSIEEVEAFFGKA